MQTTTGAYGQLSGFTQRLGTDAGASGGLNVAAVMFFVNRTPVSASGGDAGSDGGTGDGGTGSGYPNVAGECSQAGASVQSALAAEAQVAFTQTGARTFFVVLNDQQQQPQPQLDFYNGVVSQSGGAAQVVDATSTQPVQVLGSFQGSLASVASCLYELPAGVDTTASLTFSVPPNTPGLNPNAFPVPVSVASSPGCNAANSTTANGWNIDNGHIRLCGTACQNLQQTIGAVALGALQGQSDGGAEAGAPAGDGGIPAVPDVPVDVTMPARRPAVPDRRQGPKARPRNGPRETWGPVARW